MGVDKEGLGSECDGGVEGEIPKESIKNIILRKKEDISIWPR